MLSLLAAMTTIISFTCKLRPHRLLILSHTWAGVNSLSLSLCTAAFIFENDDLADRINLSATMFLTTMALLFVVSTDVPKTSSLTKIGDQVHVYIYAYIYIYIYNTYIYIYINIIVARYEFHDCVVPSGVSFACRPLSATNYWHANNNETSSFCISIYIYIYTCKYSSKDYLNFISSTLLPPFFCMVPSLRCLPLDLHVDPTVGKSPVGGCVIAIFILMSNIQGAIWWLIFKVLFESCLVSGQVFTIGDQLSKDIDIGMFWVLLVSYLFSRHIIFCHRTWKPGNWRNIAMSPHWK